MEANIVLADPGYLLATYFIHSNDKRLNRIRWLLEGSKRKNCFGITYDTLVETCKKVIIENGVKPEQLEEAVRKIKHTYRINCPTYIDFISRVVPKAD